MALRSWRGSTRAKMTKGALTLSKQLTIKDACKLLGEPLGRNSQRRMRRRLLGIETAIGKKVLFGGDGKRYWTTIRGLKELCPVLVDTSREVILLLKEELEELKEEIEVGKHRDDALKERIILLEQKVAELTEKRDQTGPVRTEY